ncbi:adenylate/guanylate cyclase domain-containing protein [Rhodococcus sp. G-MC3]|uniref:adenylate/guanylate cyclase domain-containing protein n=1 Tax=Rhodococcus sp. G-MC3 TaxID=3046209 RepID=UPI0024BB7098|nr:adenylate/guanylate cyclase domain-containing protein [Rhodococcus sp. G-MC3]MDJ0394593.1 adenylate/guanylate cyclase domain-containing protein [Rhodococcus sp. G-MC3]
MPENQISSVVQGEIEKNLLGGTPKYTRLDIVEKSGIPLERVVRLWIAMGFPVHTDPEAVVYTDADLDALRLITSLSEQNIIKPEMEVAIARTLGQSMSRLTEWQVGMVNSRMYDLVSATEDSADLDAIRRDAREIAAQTVPTLEALQSYTWRRHLAATAGRSIADPNEEATSRTLAVGFADMVGYTSLTRQLGIEELTQLLEEFESVASDVIARGRGSVIKNVGDEVMFSAQTAEDAAHIALDLQEAFAANEEMPELRVGLAWGPVLARYGDLYGSVVNIAARLTSSAHPGTILVDTTMAEELESDSEFYLKSLRSVRVRGFHKLKPHALRRNKRD